ncbi:uncharacterized protein N0V89_000241 [Didymosphaeria variabile]|uniref:Uncharacterized protein n=1 Tax=Didymosphaeria variabile TaxID=1932322 RepID=A0A9W8XWD1_9PLEO|nr:uncharacterized protein N0V89_000241 [Didymosphaeria variabile]KAJ4359685.1 hypothetical protein N0V89_000241 [Didymosphaeria variabile]
MSGRALGGGVGLNPNSDAVLDPAANAFQTSLFRPTRAVYPPPPGQPDPDDLIRDIPFQESAFSDFQSVPFAQVIHMYTPRNSFASANYLLQPPKRDVPSIVIAYLSVPQTQGPEPDWVQLMDHFRQDRCLDGPGNCQDLYVFVTRIVIPNVIIENRRLLHELYMAKRTLSANVRFRYDYWHTHDATYAPPSAEPLNAFQTRPNRPVLRSVPTPSGQNFKQWLAQPLNTPVHKQPCPGQLMHRPCALDGYLNEDEGSVRRIKPEALLQRTGKVLNLFWWISAQNACLKRYMAAGWVGIEQECYA